MAMSVVREGLCGHASGALGSMWSSQWLVRVYVAWSVVYEGLCGRFKGSRRSTWLGQ